MSIANGVATILPAPGGYIVDLDHPKSHADVATYWVVAVGNVLALLFMAQRLYTKTALLEEFRVEDSRSDPLIYRCMDFQLTELCVVLLALAWVRRFWPAS